MCQYCQLISSTDLLDIDIDYFNLPATLQTKSEITLRSKVTRGYLMQ